MGSRGPQPKPAGKRQRRNRQPSLAVVPAHDIPKSPKRLLKVTRERWVVFWESDLANITNVVHMPAIERLFVRYDERERAFRLVQKHGRLGKGSQGQIVQHPMLKYIEDCDKAILALEDRFGLSHRAMLQLGNSFADYMRAVDKQNRDLTADDDEDPRLQAL